MFKNVYAIDYIGGEKWEYKDAKKGSRLLFKQSLF